MDTTQEPHIANGAGRSSARLTELLRTEIAAGEIPAGQFLLTERKLSEKHGVARKTVRRALKTLEEEGLVTVVPRRGYRVLSINNDPSRGAPVSYLMATVKKPESWTARYNVQINAFQQAAGQRGWSMLMITAQQRTSTQMIEQARAAQTSAMILDTEWPELIEMALESGVPAVMVDAWLPEFRVDSVMQDGHQGGLLAAEHLISRGHRRIAWIGPRIGDAHSADRYGGAVAGLARADLSLPPELRVITSKQEARANARKLLSSADRPTGLIVPWTDIAMDVALEARELGLRAGKDYELVGWCVEELYEDKWDKGFGDGPAPPAITWSVETMAEATMMRLAERRAHPNKPPLRVKIPTTLRFAE